MPKRVTRAMLAVALLLQLALGGGHAPRLDPPDAGVPLAFLEDPHGICRAGPSSTPAREGPAEHARHCWLACAAAWAPADFAPAAAGTPARRPRAVEVSPIRAGGDVAFAATRYPSDLSARGPPLPIG